MFWIHLKITIIEANVQLGVVVDQDDQVSMVNEPLAGIIEGIATVNLPDGASL